MYYGDFSNFGDFGKKIRAARLKMGLKKKEAAVLIGMYPSYYGYVERSMVLGQGALGRDRCCGLYYDRDLGCS